MCEYGISFVEIETQWTESQFHLFVRAIQRRRKREEKTHSKRARAGAQRYT